MSVDGYLLWDSSAIVGYYLPESARNSAAAERAQIVIDAVRHHRENRLCLIPNIVVAEVFATFDRACYSSWDEQVNRHYGGSGRTLDKRRYRRARSRFKTDIHNGALFYQYDLNRYHVLALDLVAPIDRHRKFYRSRQTRSMGTSDLLVGAMSLHLNRLHGRDKVLLVTTDRRMSAIFQQVPKTLVANVTRSLGLVESARDLGFGDWSPDLYPRVLDLARCSVKELRDEFGEWPLKTRKARGRAPRA